MAGDERQKGDRKALVAGPPAVGETVRVDDQYASVRAVAGTQHVEVNWYGSVLRFKLRRDWRTRGALQVGGTRQMFGR